jgi:hypothetical protein
MKFVYYDDDFLAKITRKAERISADFDHGLQNWQVWQMVATIESGKAQRTHYQEAAKAARQDSWCRRTQVDYSEMTGFWWLRIETTRKPKDSEWKHVRRCRINDTGKELTDE